MSSRDPDKAVLMTTTPITTRKLPPDSFVAMTTSATEISFVAIGLKGCDQSAIRTQYDVSLTAGRFAAILESLWCPGETVLIIDIASCKTGEGERTRTSLSVRLAVGCYGPTGTTASRASMIGQMCKADLLLPPTIYDVDFVAPEALFDLRYRTGSLIVQDSITVSSGTIRASALTEFRLEIDTWQGLVETLLAVGADSRFRVTLLAARPADEQRKAVQGQFDNAVTIGQLHTDAYAGANSDRVALTLGRILEQYELPIYCGEVVLLTARDVPVAVTRRIASAVSSLTGSTRSSSVVPLTSITRSRPNAGWLLEPSAGGFRIESLPERLADAIRVGIPFYGGIAAPRLCDLLSLDAARQVFQWPIPLHEPISTIPATAFKLLPLSVDDFDSGTRVGRSRDDQIVAIDDGVRARHIHIVGTPGSGKTTLMATLIEGDLASERGFIVIDPHGDLVERVQDIARKIDRTLSVFSPKEDAVEPLALFPPRLDDGRLLPLDGIERAVGRIVEAVTSHLEDPRFAGPRFRSTSRAALMLLGVAGMGRRISSVADVLQDRTYFEDLVAIYLRSGGPGWVVSHLRNFHSQGSGDHAEVADYIVSKYQDLLSSSAGNRLVAPIGEGTEISTLMREKRNVVVNLSQSQLSGLDARLIGHVTLSATIDAMFDRQNTDKLFSVYVDEVPLFPAHNLERGLEQGRKYGIGFVLAHQFISQLPTRLRNGMVGHCGIDFVLRLTPEDSEYYASILNMSAHDLRNQPDLHAFVRMSRHGRVTPVFSLLLDKPTNGTVW